GAMGWGDGCSRHGRSDAGAVVPRAHRPRGAELSSVDSGRRGRLRPSDRARRQSGFDRRSLQNAARGSSPMNVLAANSTGTPAMKGRGIGKAFGHGALRKDVLRGVDLDLMPGQLTLLMGPSGSGKSTLLAVVSGLLQPDAGTVHALGADLWV